MGLNISTLENPLSDEQKRRTYAIYKTSTHSSMEKPHPHAYPNPNLSELDFEVDWDTRPHAWLIDIYDHQLADVLLFYAGENGIILIPKCHWRFGEKGCSYPMLEIYDEIRGY